MAEQGRSESAVDIPLKGTARDPQGVRRALATWLAPRLGSEHGLRLSEIITPSGTGVANETLLFDGTWESGGTKHTAGFAARVATDLNLYVEADIEIHAKTYEALADVQGVPVPRVYGYEADASLLGAPFFVMERMEGQVPGDSPHWRTQGFVHDASPAERRAMWQDAVGVLAALHQVDAARFPFLAPKGASSGLAEHLAYWRRFLDVTSEGSPHDVLEEGYEWLRAHMPDPAPTGFSWGDARFANIMFKNHKVVSIFDWDTVSMAGPEADLAWWRFMDGPAAELPGIGTPDELVTRWEELTGRRVRHLEFYEVFTTFRLGAIMLRLFSNLADSGVIPRQVAEHQGRESGPAQALAAQLRDLR